MEIFAGLMLCGVATTLLIPETKRRSLEQLASTYRGDKAVVEVGDDGTALATAKPK
jgi:hypothetical protein